MILKDYKEGVIVVCALPRSGSTLVCDHIADTLLMLNAGEMFHISNKRAQKVGEKVVQQCLKENKSFVCKFFPSDSIYNDSKFPNKKSKIYHVNLIRKNIARQFTSFCIAISRNKWQTYIIEDQLRKPLHFEPGFVETMFSDFIRKLWAKENFDKLIRYDEVLIYEDIVDYLNKQKKRTNPTILPSNYNFLYLNSINLLNSYIKRNDTIPGIVKQWNDDFSKIGFRT